MTSSLSGIVAAHRSLLPEEPDFVLATVVETCGSTYRKPGARMLVTRSGRFHGLLGGGCFEADLLEHVHKVFDDGRPSTVFYDMRAPEDLVWGLGLGCNGAVRIRLEYLSPKNDFAPLSLMAQILESGRRALLVTICDSGHEGIPAGSHYVYPGEITQPLPPALRNAAGAVLTDGIASLQTFKVDGKPVEAFMASVVPPPHLLIIGGGPDAVPVLQAAGVLGWRTTVVDHREAYSRPANLPGASRVMHASPEQLPQMLDLREVNAAVLMTHKFEYDLRFLRQLAGAQPAYIGLLGPAARKQELLRQAGDDLPATMAGRIYGPVGINLGGELPEEIAYSLVAEIQAVLNGRDGGHLTDLAAEQDPDLAAKLSIIVLAAGGSTRFGALKQLLEYQGRSLLKRAVETALALDAGEILVVHGPKAAKCLREIDGLPVTNLVNEAWETGMASSLKLALDAVPADTEAVLVLLCDQPLVTAGHLQQMVGTWVSRPDRIVAAEYAGTVGVPAIIPKQRFPDLRRISGDTGARKVLADFSGGLTAVPLPEAVFDIDTEQDFTELLARRSTIPE